MADRRMLRPGASILLATLVGATVAVSVASAQPTMGRAPWCVTLSHLGGTLDCGYHSLEQCMATAAGISNQCSLNPWYVEPPSRRSGRRDRRR